MILCAIKITVVIHRSARRIAGFGPAPADAARPDRAKRGQGQNRRAGTDEEKPPSPSGERQQGKAESRSAADVEKHQPHREQTHQDGSAADA